MNTSLQAKMDAAANSLRLADLFSSSLPKRFGAYQLEEVEITLDVSADGKMHILGSGVGMKGAGSMKLKFVRRKEH